jgi:transposase InsO family protein
VLKEKAGHPRWGPKKIHALLKRRGEAPPSVRTVARVLERAGQVRKRQRRPAITVTPGSQVVAASTVVNGIWSVDFKGWWVMANRARAEPLTVRDECSRKVLACQLLESTTTESVLDELVRLFADYGVPDAIRVDNGSPFRLHSRSRWTHPPFSVAHRSGHWRSVRSTRAPPRQRRP